jgi:hypothetical protein
MPPAHIEAVEIESPTGRTHDTRVFGVQGAPDSERIEIHVAAVRLEASFNPGEAFTYAWLKVRVKRARIGP